MRERKNRQRRALRLCGAMVLVAALLLGACLTPPAPGPTATRVVLVWMKHPGSASDRTRLVRAAQSLRMIPGVVKVATGRSVPSLAPGTDQSFDLGVVITFRDRAALRRYEKDPRHLDAMRRYLRPTVRRYEVFNLSGH